MGKPKHRFALKYDLVDRVEVRTMEYSNSKSTTMNQQSQKPIRVYSRQNRTIEYHPLMISLLTFQCYYVVVIISIINLP